MKFTYLLGFFVLGAVAAGAAGCGDDDETTGSGGAGGTTSSSTTTTTTGTGSTSDGNDTFETAQEVELNSQTDGSLEPPDSDVDYYTFTGTVGQQLLVQITAKPDRNPYDPTYIDTVVTLYDADQNKIAQNDDPTPRFSNDSQLFTVLPADGTYYVRVTDCNTLFPGQCGDSTLIENTDYTVYIGGISTTVLVNENPDGETSIDYSADNSAKLLQGSFSTQPETDVYTFTVPDAQPEAGHRASTWFSFFMTGPDGNGSTADIQRATVFDSSEAVVAEVNPALAGDIFAPLEPGGTYRIEIAHEEGELGNNAFYYVFDFPVVTSNPVEAETLNGPVNSNDEHTEAEALDQQDNGDGTFSYYIEGDILFSPASDKDYFAFDVPSSVDRLNIVCSAQRSGSGLREMKLTLVDASGADIPNQTSTETEAEDAFLQAAPIPSGATSMKLRVEAGSQDTPSGKYYRCGILLYTAEH